MTDYYKAGDKLQVPERFGGNRELTDAGAATANAARAETLRQIDDAAAKLPGILIPMQAPDGRWVAEPYGSEKQESFATFTTALLEASKGGGE